MFMNAMCGACSARARFSLCLDKDGDDGPIRKIVVSCVGCGNSTVLIPGSDEKGKTIEDKGPQELEID